MYCEAVDEAIGLKLREPIVIGPGEQSLNGLGRDKRKRVMAQNCQSILSVDVLCYIYIIIYSTAPVCYVFTSHYAHNFCGSEHAVSFHSPKDCN